MRRIMDSGEWDAAQVLIQNHLREEGALHGIAHRYCRLFRRLPGVEFEGRVHEQVLPSLQRAGARVGESGIRILHSGYSLGEAAMRAKQERNLSLLERELAERPGDSFMQFHRGVTLFALGRPAEAGPALRAALVGRSLPVEALALAHVKLAQLALQGSRLDEAEAHLAEARLLRPASPLVRYIAAGIEFLSGRFEACARELESLLSAGAGGAWEERLDEAEIRRDLGNCRYRLGEFGAAAREYRAATGLRPADAGLHYNLGNALYKCGEFGPALRSFEEALRADPAMDCARENAWQASLRLAESLAAEKRDAELASLSVAGGPVELALLAAGAALRAGEPERALEILRLQEGTHAESPELQFLLAMTLRESGRLDESLDRFARLQASSAENSVLLTQHALTLLAAGRDQEAATLFARALELDPLLAAPRAA
jgi:tetratricopeptide (TPR) repeat protein